MRKSPVPAVENYRIDGPGLNCCAVAADSAGVAADLGRFFDLAPDLMVIVDDRGRFVRVNDAFVRTLGYPAGELTERPSVEFIHPDDPDETLAHYPVHVASCASLGFDSRFRHRDGSYRSLRWNATALEDGYIYATAADVTNRRRDEDRACSSSSVRGRG
jgi:PAS domain S-box-containing protein